MPPLAPMSGRLWLGSTPDLLCTCHEQTPTFVQHRTELGRTLTHSLDLGRIPRVAFFSSFVPVKAF